MVSDAADQDVHTSGNKSGFTRNLQRAAQAILSLGLTASLQSSNPLIAPNQPHVPDNTPPTPDTAIAPAKAVQYGPFVDFNKLPLDQNWATKKKIAQAPSEPKTTDPVVVAVTSNAGGKTHSTLYEGNPGQARDMASVGKMVSITMLDDLIKKGVITLDEPLNAIDVKEAGLNSGITYRDAIAGAYVESNNVLAHTMVKSAIRKDMNLPEDKSVSNENVAEYLSRYMNDQGLKKSIQFNGAGYPVNADEYSGPYSFVTAPSRINRFDANETAGFFNRKFCQEGLHPSVQSMLNLKNGTPQFDHPVDSTEKRTLLPSGFQASALNNLNTKNTTFVAAKTGTSNEATAGLTVTQDNQGNCQIVLGIGSVDDRDNTIPDIASKDRDRNFVVARAPQSSPVMDPARIKPR